MKKGITGIELFEWVTNNDLLMQLSQEQSQLIVTLFNQAGYELNTDKNEIYKSFVDQDGFQEEKICIDDMIDSAAELNYEKLLDMKALCNGEINDLADYCKKIKTLISLEHNNELLDQAFSQTIYAKNIGNAIINVTSVNKTIHGEQRKITTR